MLLVPESRAFLRIVIAVLACLAALTHTLTARPYRHAEDQLIAVSGHFMLVVIFTGAGYIKAFAETVEEGQAGVSALVRIHMYLYMYTQLDVFHMCIRNLIPGDWRRSGRVAYLRL